MKKTKLIAITLLVAIALMGAGYAAWQEQLIITNTVSTGELNMVFQRHKILGVPIYPLADSFDNRPFERDYFEIEAFNQDEANDMVTISVRNMYPGATFLYDLRADNKGSIPATVDSVTVDLSNTEEAFADSISVSGAILHMRPGRILPVNMALVLDVKLSQLQAYLNREMKDWKIEVGDSIVLDLPEEEAAPGFRDQIAELIPGYDPETTNCLIFHLPLNAQNNVQDLEAQEFSIKFNFKQFNK